MYNIKNVLIVGAGAIGTAYGSILYDKDPGAVKILAEGERLLRYKRDGFIVNGKQYMFSCISPLENSEKPDLIIIAVKYHQLNEAIELMKGFVTEHTIILSLLNGISSEEEIGEIYGMDKMLYAISVGIDAVREKNSVVFSTPGKIFFGEKLNIEYTDKVRAVKKFFDEMAVSYVIPHNMVHTLWWKFMINVGVNQSSAILRAPYGVFQSSQEASEFMWSIMREVINLSQKTGGNLTNEDLESCTPIFNALSPTGKTSMLQDMEAGRKTEVEIFGETVCRLGRRYGVGTPVNDTVVKIIRAMEDINKQVEDS
jgi:2-dehydropantoate 2-reductase